MRKHFRHSKTRLLSYLSKVESVYEKLSVLIIPLSFGFGIFLAKLSPTFAEVSKVTISHFLFGLEYLAMAALLMVLAPNVAKLLNENEKNNGFSSLFLSLFVGFRGVAILWSIIFSTLIFGLPLSNGEGFENFSERA